MRQGFVLLLLAVSLAAGSQSYGQDQNQRGPRQDQNQRGPRDEKLTQPTRMLRLYEDDDYINIKGRGTDEAYTNGSRVDLFYTRHDPPHWLLDRALPKAGESSVDVYGWGIMQVMYTPRKINDPDFQPDDYPWSGGLFVTHSLFSYDPKANYDLQTEVVAGVIGPASLAGPTQKAFHHLIHYTQPMGWGHQFRNDLLLNINLTYEKQVFAVSPGADPLLELIGGGSIHAGTMENKLSAYSLLRLGIMHPYFNGLMTQYASGSSPDKKEHIELYFFARPEVDVVYTNAILEGGMFTHPPHGEKSDGATAAEQGGGQGAASGPQGGSGSPAAQGGGAGSTTRGGGATGANQGGGGSSAAAGVKGLTSYRSLRACTYSMDYGAVLALKTWSISFTQSWTSALMHGLYSHEVGNLTLYFALR
ncbi:MAG: lipid A deacylase LpxR family protein [Bacteroidetes bacterium]|nr:lipid A deacylase LpxR family protein [Bacteroidota bacterium]